MICREATLLVLCLLWHIAVIISRGNINEISTDVICRDHHRGSFSDRSSKVSIFICLSTRGLVLYSSFRMSELEVDCRPCEPVFEWR